MAIDDDELARYLASYLIDNQDYFIIHSWNHLSIYLDKDKLEYLITEFYTSLP